MNIIIFYWNNIRCIMLIISIHHYITFCCLKTIPKKLLINAHDDFSPTQYIMWITFMILSLHITCHFIEMFNSVIVPLIIFIFLNYYQVDGSTYLTSPLHWMLLLQSQYKRLKYHSLYMSMAIFHKQIICNCSFYGLNFSYQQLF